MHSKAKIVAGWLVLAFVVSAGAQTANNTKAAPDTAPVAAALQGSSGDVLREIDDPATENLWLLLRDSNHPAGPGRLVLAPRQARQIAYEKNECAPRQRIPGGEQPIIHTGDAVTVEEHTPLLDMRLQAIALEPSLKGATFKARLKIGGKVARVMAVAPGHAVFTPESTVTP